MHVPWVEAISKRSISGGNRSFFAEYFHNFFSIDSPKSERRRCYTVAHYGGKEIRPLVLFDNQGYRHVRILRSHSGGVSNRGTVQHRGQLNDSLVQRGHRGEHFRIIQQGGFAEGRLELVNKVNQAARSVNQ